MFKKLLKFLWIFQEKKHKDTLNVTRKYRRLNPFNPLTYIAIVIIILVGFVMFGIVGFWKEVDLRNPFRWS
jgi:hypothetical protein